MTKQPRKPRTDPAQSVHDDIQAILANSAVDEIAEYAKRGRVHEALPIEQLIEKWRLAFEDLAIRPLHLQALNLQSDLSSEFLLRGIERPYNLIEDAVHRYFAASKRAIARLEKKHPESRFQADAWLRQQIEDLKSRLKQSN